MTLSIVADVNVIVFLPLEKSKNLALGHISLLCCLLKPQTLRVRTKQVDLDTMESLSFREVAAIAQAQLRLAAQVLQEPPLPLPSFSPRNRGRMPQIPEQQDEMLPGGSRSRWPRINSPPSARGRGSSHQRRTRRGVSPLTLYNTNNTDLFNNSNTNASATINIHHNRNREEEFKDYDCCPECYCSELMMMCQLRNLPTPKIEHLKPEEKPVPVEDQVRPLEAYVNATDKLIAKLLAEMK